MRAQAFNLIFALLVLLILVSCSHQGPEIQGQNRNLAQSGCKIKGEYHSYFDEAEKCLENSRLK